MLPTCDDRLAGHLLRSSPSRPCAWLVALLGLAALLQPGPLAADDKAKVGQGAERVSEQPMYTNRLIDSRDPYLLLHAHNPVDWYPWGPEAPAKARQENKPI